MAPAVIKGAATGAWDGCMEMCAVFIEDASQGLIEPSDLDWLQFGPDDPTLEWSAKCGQVAQVCLGLASGAGMAKIADDVPVLLRAIRGLKDLLRRRGVREPNRPNGLVWEWDDAEDAHRLIREQHPLRPGEVFDPAHHGEHFHHYKKRKGPGGEWEKQRKMNPDGTPGSDRFLPGEPIPFPLPPL